MWPVCMCRMVNTGLSVRVSVCPLGLRSRASRCYTQTPNRGRWLPPGTPTGDGQPTNPPARHPTRHPAPPPRIHQEEGTTSSTVSPALVATSSSPRTRVSIPTAPGARHCSSFTREEAEVGRWSVTGGSPGPSRGSGPPPSSRVAHSVCALWGFGGAPPTAGLPQPGQGWTWSPQACQPLHPLPRGLQLLGFPRLPVHTATSDGNVTGVLCAPRETSNSHKLPGSEGVF